MEKVIEVVKKVHSTPFLKINHKGTIKVYEGAGRFPLDRLAAFIHSNPKLEVSQEPCHTWTNNKDCSRVGQIDKKSGKPFPGAYYREELHGGDEQIIVEYFTVDAGDNKNCLMRFTDEELCQLVPVVDGQKEGYALDTHTYEAGNMYQGGYLGDLEEYTERSGFGIWTKKNGKIVKQGFWEETKLLDDGKTYN